MISIVAGLIVLWTIVTYNRLVRSRLLVAEGFSGIDVQLKRRHSLIPNLVEVVRSYSQHEHDVLDDVTRLRSQTVDAENMDAKQRDENALTDRLRSLLAIVEAYPDLKADGQFHQLHENLVEIEDQIQYARRYYNGTVRDYNTAVMVFPNNIIAEMFSFGTRNFFQVECATVRENVKVDLGA